MKARTPKSLSGQDTSEDLTLARAKQAAKITDRNPARRAGRLGGCMACMQTIASHFKPQGLFIGCTAADADTIFVLKPMRVADAEASLVNQKRKRQFRRAHYTVTSKGQHADRLPSQRYKLVLQAVADAGKKGTILTEVMQRSGLARGSVAEALAWLRERDFVQARELTETEEAEIGK